MATLAKRINDGGSRVTAAGCGLNSASIRAISRRDTYACPQEKRGAHDAVMKMHNEYLAIFYHSDGLGRQVSLI